MADNKITQTNDVKETKFFEYKGYPLVRNKDEIYFGNMTDKYVVWMQIKEKTKVGDLDVASKVKIFKLDTDKNLPVKQSEKNGLYEALDIAYAWLSRK